MIELIRRTITTLLSGAMIVYLGSLMSQQTLIVQSDYSGLNTLMYIGLILLSSYIIVVYGIYPLYHPMQKRTLL